MDVDNRKSEAKADFKRQDILIEVSKNFCTSNNHNYSCWL
jgi:hypothetical protein